jgi:hypothetical protein
MRIGSHLASARIANREPTNCFNPAPKPNEKRVNDELTREVRVNWFNVTPPSDAPGNPDGASDRSVEVDRTGFTVRPAARN